MRCNTVPKHHKQVLQHTHLHQQAVLRGAAVHQQRRQLAAVSIRLRLSINTGSTKRAHW